MDYVIYDENELFVFSSPDSNIDQTKYLYIKDKIYSVCSYFGIRYLPSNLKFKINIVQKEIIGDLILRRGLNIPEFSYALTLDAKNIYVTSFQNVSNIYSIDEYLSIILHECIHVIQGYYSLVNPNKCIWLYETIAVFLADQKPKKRKDFYVKWEDFINNFYNIESSYEIAYFFGYSLFNNFSKDHLLEMIKAPENNILLFKSEFEKITKESDILS